MSFPLCISQQECTEHPSYCSVRVCPEFFFSPGTTDLSFPLILTSKCCLHMSRLYCFALSLVSSLAMSSFPLSSQSRPYMSQYPIIPHLTLLRSSYLHLPVFSPVSRQHFIDSYSDSNYGSGSRQNFWLRLTRIPTHHYRFNYKRIVCLTVIVDACCNECIMIGSIMIFGVKRPYLNNLRHNA